MSVDLDEIRRRLNGATPGPWNSADFGYSGNDEPHTFVIFSGEEFDWNAVERGELVASTPSWDIQASNNAYFIAYARTDVGELCDEVEALRATIERVHALQEEWDRVNKRGDRAAGRAASKLLKALVSDNQKEG